MKNPFLSIDQPSPWGPGSFEMALPLVESAQIQMGMLVLEVGGGSGQIAAVLAKFWDVHVITLEPWRDGTEIRDTANRQGVGNRVLPLRLQAQSLPFPTEAFDAVISVGSFEMIGEERPRALAEMVRVARKGAFVGIAEPMCQTETAPTDIAVLDATHGLQFQECFRTLEWNAELFRSKGLEVTEAYHFPQAQVWWMDYRHRAKISDGEKELILKDEGRWISLGLVVGRKQ